MSVIYSGFTALTAQRLLNGPGVLIANYEREGTRILGATNGGCSFDPGITYRTPELDIPFDNVKGLKRISKVNPMLQGNLKEIGSGDSLAALYPGLAALQGTIKRDVARAEYLGSGDGAQTAFTTANNPVIAKSERVYVNGAVKLRTTDYAIDNATGVITFTVAPGAGAAVTVTYTYDTGVASAYTAYRIGQLTDEDYFSNVALLCATSGGGGIMVIVEEALPEVSGAISLDQDDEATVDVSFMGHATPEGIELMNLDPSRFAEVVPFEIREYPPESLPTF